MQTRRRILMGLGASAVATGAVRPAIGLSAQDFLSGADLRWIVPYRPGGGYDEYTRLLAPYIEAHSGADVDIVNMPGSGGRRGATEIFRSPTDGLHLGVVNGSGLASHELAHPEAARYRLAEFTYLGRISAEARVLIVRADGPIDGIAALRAAGRPIVFGATGLGGSTYLDAAVAGHVLSLSQKVVHGFNNSADVRLALLRGDIDGMWGSLGSAVDGVAGGDFRVIVHGGTVAAEGLGGTPSLRDAAREVMADGARMALLDAWQAMAEVGRPIVAPPGVSAERTALLRDVIAKAMADPGVQADAGAAKRTLNPLSGEDMAALALRASVMAPDTRALLIAALKGEL